MALKQTQWTRQYGEKAYDRISVTVPTGNLDKIKEAAEAEGVSVNGFIARAILARMGLEAWPIPPLSERGSGERQGV